MLRNDGFFMARRRHDLSRHKLGHARLGDDDFVTASTLRDGSPPASARNCHRAFHEFLTRSLCLGERAFDASVHLPKSQRPSSWPWFAAIVLTLCT